MFKSHFRTFFNFSKTSKVFIIPKYFRKYKIEILNGFHDTSGSYLAYNQNKIKNKILIINTGTYFVISNKTKFKNSIKNINHFCGIGQCQKCIIKVNNETKLACLTLPKENDHIRNATQNIK